MITESLGKQFLWSIHVCVYYFALLGSCSHCIACCRKNGRQNEMGKELRESTGNRAATVMATGDRSRPQGIHSRGKSIFFRNPCSKSYHFWLYELKHETHMFLFPYLLQYLKSTLIKQPCDRLLSACADRQLLHEGQLTLIGSYNSYVNRSKISKLYRCGSQFLVGLVVYLYGV